jgi:hypothetical protein
VGAPSFAKRSNLFTGGFADDGAPTEELWKKGRHHAAEAGGICLFFTASKGRPYGPFGVDSGDVASSAKSVILTAQT